MTGKPLAHSYGSDDHTKTFCIDDGPDGGSIRTAVERNGLPVNSITRVSVLDPYYYT